MESRVISHDAYGSFLCFNHKCYRPSPSALIPPRHNALVSDSTSAFGMVGVEFYSAHTGANLLKVGQVQPKEIWAFHGNVVFGYNSELWYHPVTPSDTQSACCSEPDPVNAVGKYIIIDTENGNEIVSMVDYNDDISLAVTDWMSGKNLTPEDDEVKNLLVIKVGHIGKVKITANAEVDWET